MHCSLLRKNLTNYKAGRLPSTARKFKILSSNFELSKNCLENFSIIPKAVLEKNDPINKLSEGCLRIKLVELCAIHYAQ